MPKKSKKHHRRAAGIPLPSTPPSEADTEPFSPYSPGLPSTPAAALQTPLKIIGAKDLPIRSLLDPCYNSNLPLYLPRDISFWQLLDPSEAVLTKMWEAVVREYIAATKEKYHRNLLGHARR